MTAEQFLAQYNVFFDDSTKFKGIWDSTSNHNRFIEMAKNSDKLALNYGGMLVAYWAKTYADGTSLNMSYVHGAKVQTRNLRVSLRDKIGETLFETYVDYNGPLKRKVLQEYAENQIPLDYQR